MIDTDKYKGHLVDDFQVWVWSSKMLKVANYEEQMATASLLKDTSLLLAEVERLREENHEMGIALHDLGYRWDEETGEMYHRDDTRRGD